MLRVGVELCFAARAAKENVFMLMNAPVRRVRFRRHAADGILERLQRCRVFLKNLGDHRGLAFRNGQLLRGYTYSGYMSNTYLGYKPCSWRDHIPALCASAGRQVEHAQK